MFRLLPVLLLTAALAFTVRVGEVVTGFRDLSGAAVAEDKKAKDPAPHTDDKGADVKKDDQKMTEKEMPAAKGHGSADKGDSKTKWPDPVDMDPELAAVRAGLVKDLAERRKLVETQEKALATREAVLKAAESELDQKYKELTDLQKQLRGLLNQQSEEESARIKSLVRIYEGMKPADAARIFNTLDTTILLDVMSRMSERKSSPVLAAMDPDRARTITLLMAQQKSLPELPELIEPEAGEDSVEGASAQETPAQ
jgi:flagellar motility protein MotE (MotC chaperone)